MKEWIEKVLVLAVGSVRSGGGPFAAMIVRDGTVIATGLNAVVSSKDPTAHAEVVAIRAACQALGDFKLTGCEIYCSCEPCPMCLGALYWARPARVYFAATRDDAAAAGFDDAFIYDQLVAPASDRALPAVHLATPSALAPFEEWLRKADRTPY
jgi:guanine deaminase